jgi:hypothetical protein
MNAPSRTARSTELRLPDFIIGGAMKSGTTTLHYALSQHRSIFIPSQEIFFFSIDDIEQHPNFFVPATDGWTFFDYDREFERYVHWYAKFFRDAQPSQIVGEDSTTYLAAANAARRIAELLPDVKLLFLLRDPVRRAYSHYWHLVRIGDAVQGFEETIARSPGTLLQRGFYKRQVERFLEVFPRERIMFLVFEDFVPNLQARIDRVCTFLGVDGSVDVSRLDTHRNPGLVPRNLGVQLAYNRLLQRRLARRFLDHLPLSSSQRRRGVPRIVGVAAEKALLVDRDPPRMKDATRAFLEKLFARENRGLSSLVGEDLNRYWPWLEEH